MFDLSVAFDTIDHGIILQKLFERFGDQGDVLKWIQSYIPDNEHYVFVARSSLRKSPLS